MRDGDDKNVDNEVVNNDVNDVNDENERAERDFSIRARGCIRRLGSGLYFSSIHPLGNSAPLPCNPLSQPPAVVQRLERTAQAHNYSPRARIEE